MYCLTRMLLVADCSQNSGHQQCSVSSECKCLCSVAWLQPSESWGQARWCCSLPARAYLAEISELFFCCQSCLLCFGFLSSILYLTGCSQVCRGVMREDPMDLSPIRGMRQKEISWNWALKRLNETPLTVLDKGLVQFLAAQCPVAILFFYVLW